MAPLEPGDFDIDEVDVIPDITDFPDTPVTGESDLEFPITGNNFEVVGAAKEFFDLTVEVIMDRAAEFATFDPDTGTFEVQAEKLNPLLNGVYKTDVVATLTERRSRRKKVYTFHYFLTIDVPKKVLSPICEEGFVIGADCDEDEVF